MVSVDDFKEVKDCIYKEEHYSVRDNGAVFRHSKEGKRLRKDDNVWTFGRPNAKTGYMELSGHRIHRIVAYAFLGNPPTEQHVVDHIDTNRRNNRPDNLRWLTRLENCLNNPITKARIEYVCGSIEAFLANPSMLKGHEDVDVNFSWMRAVSPEEAKASLERLTNWAKNPPASQGGTMGDWIYQTHRTESVSGSQTQFESSWPFPESNFPPQYPDQRQEYTEPEEIRIEKQSLTPNAIQVNWRIPSEFPCCPQTASENPLAAYLSNLKVDAVFCRNEKYSTLVVDSAIVDEGKSLFVMTKSERESMKPWALAKITYKNGVFYHESEGTYFREDGVQKYFTLAQGKEWTGGDVFDDYC